MKNKILQTAALLGALAVFALMAIGSGSSDEPKKVENTAAGATTEAVAATTEAPAAFTVGDTVELSDVVVTFVGMTESKGSDFNKPADGNVYVLCEFTIENKSNEEISVSSMLNFDAYCDDFSVSQSIGALIEKDNKGQLDGSIAAGKKMNGVIGYEVSADFKKMEIQYKPNLFSDKAITFEATR